jgi:hypothetical protein
VEHSHKPGKDNICACGYDLNDSVISVEGHRLTDGNMAAIIHLHKITHGEVVAFMVAVLKSISGRMGVSKKDMQDRVNKEFADALYTSEDIHAGTTH